jgi:hypothetical protein
MLIVDVHFVVCLVALLGVTAALLWGILTTARQGIQSVSQFFDDNHNIAVFFGLVTIWFGQARLLFTLDYTLKHLRQSDFSMHALVVAASVAGALQIAFMELVIFVPLSYNRGVHFAMAASSTVFGILRAVLMLVRRDNMHRKLVVEGKHLMHPDLWFLVVCSNALFILVMIAFAGVFAAFRDDSANLDTSPFEWVVLYLIVFDTCYEQFDLRFERLMAKSR